MYFVLKLGYSILKMCPANHILSYFCDAFGVMSGIRNQMQTRDNAQLLYLFSQKSEARLSEIQSTETQGKSEVKR